LHRLRRHVRVEAFDRLLLHVDTHEDNLKDVTM
jgi:hypothetical protein